MRAKGRYSAAFQGEKRAFSHSAALKLLGEAVQPVACASFKNVFEALRDDRVTHAVIPIENTLHGSVLENYDYLIEFGFPIRGETSVRISHNLISDARDGIQANTAGFFASCSAEPVPEVLRAQSAHTSRRRSMTQREA